MARVVRKAASPRRPLCVARTGVRLLMGVALVGAGVSHLTVAREEFRAQVPEFVPLPVDVTVIASGVAEIVIGAALVAAPRRVRPVAGAVAAAFFVAIFPGNIAQWVHGRDGFGLDTDAARFSRLFFQPVLVAGALWSTGAWKMLRQLLRARKR